MDTGLIDRMIQAFAKIPARFLVNVGNLANAYSSVPDNVHLDSWYPQPSVLAKSDLFIHHGGNNSFCEALHFGVPSLIMPYCWDGHDNARRAVEVGVGSTLHRSRWKENELTDAIHSLLADQQMRRRLAVNAEKISASPGAETAADSILRVVA
jgi:UDP:flavonoid glycosyltransferase YjiC (YdhE family)